MKASLLVTTLGCLATIAAVPALAQDQGSGDAWIFNTSYNTSGNIGTYAQVGGEFQLPGNNVPSGDTVYVTALGWYSTSGLAPSVNIDVNLYGPSTTTKFASTSGNEIASGVVAAGTDVSSDGFAWVTLSTPVALTAGDYYNLIENAASGSVSYLQPYDDGSTGHAAAVPSAGSPITLFEGVYGYGAGNEAYSDSEYLGPNLQYEIEGPNPVPEPAALALLSGGLAMGLGFRRRR